MSHHTTKHRKLHALRVETPHGNRMHYFKDKGMALTFARANRRLLPGTRVTFVDSGRGRHFTGYSREDWAALHRVTLKSAKRMRRRHSKTRRSR